MIMLMFKIIYYQLLQTLPPPREGSDKRCFCLSVCPSVRRVHSE